MKVAVEYLEDVVYPDKENLIYPDEFYPELKINYDKVSQDNKVFSMLRAIFIKMGYDKENFNSPEWNPLGHIIKPGNVVLLKPNLVLDKNPANLGEDCLYTNPSIVSAMINYVWIALKGSGKIIVADAPVQQCDFENLIETSGYKRAVEFFKSQNIDIDLLDLRGLKSKKENGVLIQETNQKNGIVVDLGAVSQHAKLSVDELKKIRITDYDPKELLNHHNQEKHEYCIAEEILSADVIINMPKPKSHRKAGLTISLKNMVGANVRKEYLPHHRMGDKNNGGDEYSSKSVFLKANGKFLDLRNSVDSKTNRYKYIFYGKMASVCSHLDKALFSKQSMREGSWYGNDTIWRTIIDLNKVILYADKNGVMRDTPQRKMIVCADMIVVGEKEGPLLPSPKYCGIISYSENNVCFDEAIATLMGFDINKFPLFSNTRGLDRYPLINDPDNYATIISNNEKWNSKSIYEFDRNITLNIEPCSEWKGHIELGV